MANPTLSQARRMEAADLLAIMVAGTNPDGTPFADPSATPGTNVTTTGRAASLLIKNAAGTLFGVMGYNAKSSQQFIQFHDAAALPADGAVPVITFPVAALTPFSIDWSPKGRAFVNGIVVCNSSTEQTKTIGAADCWFDAQRT